ncbi:MAG: hypothetical protein K9N09_04265 [Candidatus Cloacimonetes bacterium]|nr:hypothetical protein [Candidatus Cloacimonadota bacterium]MCF7814838.1 hypothetical protein [Candidatus Cloacimonadota bacterium]MCF7867894.1 hypothetical protein [Candidatus Cloacimonadota bacterium]MCF7883713.1 hypothetical protein [Candidatus Cloacimonadota bacterium]
MKNNLLILAILIVLLAALLLIWNRDENLEDGIVIMQNDQELIISFPQIDKLQKHNFTTNRGDEFTGILLSEILENYDYNKLKLHSSDGGNLILNREDISNAYIIEMDDIDERSFRLIIPTDEFRQRWMKYIKSIELN